MDVGSIITGAVPPAAQAAAGVRAALPPHRLNYPLWGPFLTDMVAGTRRYRHAVPPGPRLAARRSASPPAERQ
jgi:hypothetical protein